MFPSLFPSSDLVQIATMLCRSRRRHADRRASVLTELAICLPVLTLLVLGSIDIANSIHLKHTATLVAYETGQVATTQGGTEAAGSAKGQALLIERGISNATITYSPRITSNTVAGTSITITVSLPANGNTLGLTGLFMNRTITVSVVMRKM
jgi:Flp pilus assembly protein TadG